MIFFEGEILEVRFEKNAKQEEALCEASRQDHAEGVRLLLAARAEPLAQPAGKTALHAACEAGHEAVARLLVQAEPAAVGASGEALGGRTPLICRVDTVCSLLLSRSLVSPLKGIRNV